MRLFSCVRCLLPFYSAGRFSAEWVLGRLRVFPIFGVFAVLQAPGVREVYHVRLQTSTAVAMRAVYYSYPLAQPSCLVLCARFCSTTTACDFCDGVEPLKVPSASEKTAILAFTAV